MGLLGRVEPDGGPRALALAVYALIGVTDLLDGYLARRWQSTSRFGSVLDALADRLIRLVPLFLFALVGLDAFPPVPLWLPVGVLLLDAVPGTAWIALRARGRRPPVEHHPVGRVATALSFGLVLWITAGLAQEGVVVIGGLVLGLGAVASVGHLRRWLRGVDTSRTSL